MLPSVLDSLPSGFWDDASDGALATSPAPSPLPYEDTQANPEQMLPPFDPRALGARRGGFLHNPGSVVNEPVLPRFRSAWPVKPVPTLRPIVTADGFHKC